MRGKQGGVEHEMVYNLSGVICILGTMWGERFCSLMYVILLELFVMKTG